MERSVRLSNWPKYQLKEIAKICGGKIVGCKDDFKINGLCVDESDVDYRRLFLAIYPRQRNDAHDYIRDVFNKGGVALVSKEIKDSEGPQIIVDNIVTSLQNWAKHHLDKQNLLIIGITGSVGKTSVKEILTCFLRTRYNVHNTFHNNNGQIGVPITILQTPPDAEAIVLEMGISYKDEMRKLRHIVTPNIAVITQITNAHLGNFGSIKELVDEKKKIIDLHFARQPRLCVAHYKSASLIGKTNCPILTYGFDQRADISGFNINFKFEKKDQYYSTFLLRGFSSKPVKVKIPYIGHSMVENYLCGFAVGKILGLDLATMIETIKDNNLELPMRQEVNRTRSLTWINDTFNSCPASVSSALEILRLFPNKGRKIAIIGDMLELGTFEIKMHMLLSKDIERSADWLITYGNLANHINKCVSIRSNSFNNFDELVDFVISNIKKDDLLLIKASRKMNLNKLSLILKDRNVDEM